MSSPSTQQGRSAPPAEDRSEETIEGNRTLSHSRVEAKDLSLRWKIAQLIFAVLIPVAGLVAAWHWTGAQHQLQMDQHRADLDLKILEIFLREITSENQTRQRGAMVLLKEMLTKRPDLGPTLLRVAAEINPGLSVDAAADIASDRSNSDYVRGEATRARYEISSQFKINKPVNNGEVGRVAPVDAETPYTGLHHYIVVTADKTKVSYLEEKLEVRPSGTISGSARFGAAGVGIGETFTLEILATELRERELRDEWPKLPDGALWSNAVRVTRTLP